MADTSELTRTVDGVALPQPGTYVFDKAHTNIGFIVRHLMVSKVRGKFGEFEGTIVVADDPSASSVTVTVQMASIHTGDEQRDGHLRSADFFEIEKYPVMTFTSTRILPSGADWKVEGDLTIHGVTQSTVLEVEFNGAQADPYGKSRVGFSAAGEINRDDFGVTFNMALETGGVMVSNTIKLELEVEAILEG